MINTSEILQTVRMITEEKLDIRTITMGISLYDCVHPDRDILYRNVYDRITTQAKDLVRTGEALEREFGIPIVNKRISVTPASLVAAACGDPVVVARAMDAAAKETGVNYIENNNMLVSGEFVDKPDFAKYNKYVIPEDEAYAANCIWMNGKVIVPDHFPKVAQIVRDAGYEVILVDTSEYRKIDGGLSCLSLRFTAQK